jgi:D-amino peptidase
LRIFISIDMEGISCIVSWREVGEGPSQFEYARARMNMVGDLNAAIDGAFEAGANEIVVADAHSMRRTIARAALSTRGIQSSHPLYLQITRLRARYPFISLK